MRARNWNDIFKDETQIRASLERLKPIRDAIAHNRPLSDDQRMILDVEKKYIESCIERKL
jgi:hypothetical protein